MNWSAWFGGSASLSVWHWLALFYGLMALEVFALRRRLGRAPLTREGASLSEGAR